MLQEIKEEVITQNAEVKDSWHLLVSPLPWLTLPWTSFPAGICHFDTLSDTLVAVFDCRSQLLRFKAVMGNQMAVWIFMPSLPDHPLSLIFRGSNLFEVSAWVEFGWEWQQNLLRMAIRGINLGLDTKKSNMTHHYCQQRVGYWVLGGFFQWPIFFHRKFSKEK